MNGAAIEGKGLPDSIFQITGVGEVGALLVIAEKDDGRRGYGDHRGIDDLESGVIEIGGRIHLLGIGDDGVQNIGGDPTMV